MINVITIDKIYEALEEDFMFSNLIHQYRMNKTTNNIRKTAKSCGELIRVNGYSYVNKNTILGNNINFNGMKIIGDGPVIIGNNFHSGEGCYIISQNHNYDYGNCIPYDSEYSIEKETVIEDNVWIGVGVIILAGVHIGEGAIIQAGSVVIGEIAPYCIAGGHPAIKFKERNINHYEKLKSEGKFW